MSPKRIAILGSTGSIGRQTLEVISQDLSLRACALAAGGNWKMLAQQARKFRPEMVALADPCGADQIKADLPAGVELLAGPDALTEMVRRSRPDVLLSGVVGTAGLVPTLEAIKGGATLAIANKETLVMAGQIVMSAARQAGVSVLPVDSEHSAVFQCLQAGARGEVRKVWITASGGALREWDEKAVESATVEQALNHPTWRMGRKITIDSATMVNKSLELVEAHWLFGLSAEQLEVLLHPESIIHSMVEFCDGSVVAQMARPDMKMPIAFALGYPRRPVREVAPLDLVELGKLTFLPLKERFIRALKLGYDVIRRGGLCGAVLNGANEAAVEAFLAGRILFGQIVPLVEAALARTPAGEVTLEAVMDADAWARRTVAQLIEQGGLQGVSSRKQGRKSR